MSQPSVIGSALLSFVPKSNKAGALAGVYLINSITAVLPVFWQWTASNTGGATKRAFAAALISGSFSIGMFPSTPSVLPFDLYKSDTYQVESSARRHSKLGMRQTTARPRLPFWQHRWHVSVPPLRFSSTMSGRISSEVVLAWSRRRRASFCPGRCGPIRRTGRISGLSMSIEAGACCILDMGAVCLWDALMALAGVKGGAGGYM